MSKATQGDPQAYQDTLWRRGRDPDFGGRTFDEDRDGERLRAQLRRVLRLMSDNRWYTLGRLSALTGDPEASVSARIRDLRKDKYGRRIVTRRYVGQGLWEYRLEPLDPPPPPAQDAGYQG